MQYFDAEINTVMVYKFGVFTGTKKPLEQVFGFFLLSGRVPKTKTNVLRATGANTELIM